MAAGQAARRLARALLQDAPPSQPGVLCIMQNGSLECSLHPHATMIAAAAAPQQQGTRGVNSHVLVIVREWQTRMHALGQGAAAPAASAPTWLQGAALTVR